MMDLFLRPGDCWFGRTAGSAETILGSCISVVLFHPTLKHMGVSHCLLPSRRRKSDLSAPFGWFVDDTLQWFAQQMHDVHTQPSQFQAWLVGGGDMFPSVQHRHAIGQANILAAEQGLARLGIPLQGSDVGGCCYRKLHVRLQDALIDVKREPVRQGRELLDPGRDTDDPHSYL